MGTTVQPPDLAIRAPRAGDREPFDGDVGPDDGVGTSRRSC
jgi:hypothetical protein